MSKRLMISLQILICAILTSCKEKVKIFGESEKSEVKEEVHNMFSQYFAAIKREGLQAEFEFLDNSSDFFWVPPGFNSAISYDSVKTILMQNSASLKLVEFYWSALEIYPLSYDIANYTGIVKGTIVDQEGIANNVSMIESGTVICREGNWRILSGQSRNLPK